MLAVCSCGAAFAFAPKAKPRPKPDLVVAKLSNPPSSLAIGLRFPVSSRIRNVGKGRAGASEALFYLSSDAQRSQNDLLAGSAHVGRLAKGKQKLVKASLAVPPAAPPGSYFVIACADGNRRIKETKEKNNCRASQKPATLACIAGDADCDGVPAPADCNDQNPAIRPGAPDNPDLAFVDSNCDGIDGDAQRAVFVSTAGNDADPGTRARPKLTLSAAVATAAAQHKDVYAGLGRYGEPLHVANGVGVFGGYDGAWQRSLSNVSLIAGGPTHAGAFTDVEAAFAADVTAPTALQLLTLAPPAPASPGASSYGLRGVRSGGLRLQYVTINTGAGTAGSAGANGSPGLAGGKGGDARRTNPAGPFYMFGLAGTSPVGRKGGAGGEGGYTTSGGDGGTGLSTTPDSFGRVGGPGGQGGAGGGSSSFPGGKGNNGDSGAFPGDVTGGTADNASTTPGLWLSQPGHTGHRGSNGHGGGGGGGGGSQQPFFANEDASGGGGGGGGGGGEGGGGGSPGQGGGGSFGIFLVDSPGAIVQDSTIASAAGGAGGAGGQGAQGGVGGGAGIGGGPESSKASSGGDGAPGGAGSRGGAGGGGAGGPSVAIFGMATSQVQRTSLSYGTGGTGGTGGGTGATGPVGDFY
jgi:hypothetical protein